MMLQTSNRPCEALTVDGDPCGRTANQTSGIDGRERWLCGVHARTARRGAITLGDGSPPQPERGAGTHAPPLARRTPFPDCEALTRRGTRCRREGIYRVLVGEREARLCDMHTKTAQVESLPLALTPTERADGTS